MIRLVAQVRAGVLTGRQDPGPAQVGTLALSGKIQPDGKATIDARGTVGDLQNAANQLRQGQGYAYTVDAVFDDTRGIGQRSEVRPCTLTFAR